jgi:hypothetical protein
MSVHLSIPVNACHSISRMNLIDGQLPNLVVFAFCAYQHRISIEKTTVLTGYYRDIPYSLLENTLGLIHLFPHFSALSFIMYIFMVGYTSLSLNTLLIYLTVGNRNLLLPVFTLEG